jgi:hypothetical protein
MIFINSPPPPPIPPESNGEGNSAPGEYVIGPIKGLENICDPDREGCLYEDELPTLTCRDEEDELELRRCLILDSPNTPRADKLLRDMTCIASSTDPWE